MAQTILIMSLHNNIQGRNESSAIHFGQVLQIIPNEGQFADQT